MKNLIAWIVIIILVAVLITVLRLSPWGENLSSSPMASGNLVGVGEVLAKTGAAIVEKKTDDVGLMAKIETDDALPTPTPYPKAMPRDPNEGFTHVMGSREKPIVTEYPPSEGFTHQMGRREAKHAERPEQQMVFARRMKMEPRPERPAFEQNYAPRLHGPRSETAQNMGMMRTNRGRWVYEGQLCICGPATPKGQECIIVPRNY